MIKRVSAKYANGMLTPLEPLNLEEGTVVVLDIEMTASPKEKTDNSKFRVIPFHSEFLPGMDDPKKMKQLLEDEDIEHFLRVRDHGKGT
jgi:predicted DNA-binding antitoxin AbrB/MazE fold protein